MSKTLPSVDPARLRLCALQALGVCATPTTSQEARRYAAVELFAAFRDECDDDDLPAADAWEVYELETQLHPVIAKAMRASGCSAVAVDFDSLCEIVPTDIARLALFLHGIYPMARTDGRTIWGCDLAHAGERAAWVSFGHLRWACGRHLVDRDARNISININLGPAN